MKQVVLYPGEDGYWVAECPSRPGRVSQGKMKEGAIANIRGGDRRLHRRPRGGRVARTPERFETIVVAV